MFCFISARKLWILLFQMDPSTEQKEHIKDYVLFSLPHLLHHVRGSTQKWSVYALPFQWMNKRQGSGKVPLSNTIICEMPGVYTRFSSRKTFENETKGIFKCKGHSFQARKGELQFFFLRGAVCKKWHRERYTQLGCANAAKSPRQPAKVTQEESYLSQQVLMLMNLVPSEAGKSRIVTYCCFLKRFYEYFLFLSH